MSTTSTYTPQRIHLIANAHIDPVWLWNWEEGAAEAVATFRSAAAICEENPTFVFNHNEALLYQWIEEFDPPLFERIRALVRIGQWRIMGGWFLQPDCNLPSGESLVRQILVGRRYFLDKFGEAPETAINFDPFGHSRGLVQILAKSGFKNYLVCRPEAAFCTLPGEVFWWEGFDGSRVLCRRTQGLYNSHQGRVLEKVDDSLKGSDPKQSDCVLWGVGNHGGGPSREDLKALENLRASDATRAFVHSTPDAYFSDMRGEGHSFPVFRGELNRWAVGCYTSAVRIKQAHRALENELFAAEKACSAAALRGLPYPTSELTEAQRDLLFSQFHDILPGSCVQTAEQNSLRLIEHGREIASRLRARAVFTLARDEAPAAPETNAFIVFNPHPYAIDWDVDCEFQLAAQNWSDAFMDVEIWQGPRRLASQLEKEASNMPLDWRKRVVFHARLEPLGITRFDVKIQAIKGGLHRPVRLTQPWTIQTPFYSGTISDTGSLSMGLPGQAAGICQGTELEVIDDRSDTWGSTVTRLGDTVGRFTLLSPAEAAAFAGVNVPTLCPLQLIEDGPVRSVVEGLYGYGESRARIRYTLPKHSPLVSVEIEVNWRGVDQALKLALTSGFTPSTLLGQTAFGLERLPSDGSECAYQRYALIHDTDATVGIACLNDGTYGIDCHDRRLRPTLLRSPAYSAHEVPGHNPLRNDRFTPRIDQGVRVFRFWLVAGDLATLRQRCDAWAAACNEQPFAVAMCPGGSGQQHPPALTLSSPDLILSAFKRSESGEQWVARIFNPLSTPQSTTATLAGGLITHTITLGPSEVKTLIFNTTTKRAHEADLIEEALAPAPGGESTQLAHADEDGLIRR
jgi:alpha-mannosidase